MTIEYSREDQEAFIDALRPRLDGVLAGSGLKRRGKVQWVGEPHGLRVRLWLERRPSRPGVSPELLFGYPWPKKLERWMPKIDGRAMPWQFSMSFPEPDPSWGGWWPPDLGRAAEFVDVVAELAPPLIREFTLPALMDLDPDGVTSFPEHTAVIHGRGIQFQRLAEIALAEDRPDLTIRWAERAIRTSSPTSTGLHTSCERLIEVARARG